MNYFYTEQQLGIILNTQGGLVWSNYGFTDAGVTRAVAQGYQIGSITMLPIEDEVQFEATLGAVIANSPDEDGKVSKTISKEEATAIRDRLKVEQEVATAEAARNAPLSTDEKLDLIMASMLESEGII